MKPYYEDDLVTLYLGNCLEQQEWLTADVLVTDPPYGVAWEQGALDSKRAVRIATVQSIAGDESTAIRDAAVDLWGKRPAVIFGAWREARPPRVTHRLIWHKAGRVPGVSPHPFYPADEEVYLCGSGWRGSPPIPSVITTTEQRSRQPGLIGHPTPKPVGLMETLIARCPAATIADPFAGSGATLLAARNLRRKAIGVELEERYCEIIARRLSHTVFDFGEWEA